MEKEWWENHEGILWWNTLTLEQQQNKMYYSCTSQGKGAFEFTIQDIIDIWENNVNKN